MQNALQILRTDPSSATGFSPAELILGRKLVYPFEIETMDVDFDGNELFYFSKKKRKNFFLRIDNLRRGIHYANDSKFAKNS